MSIFVTAYADSAATYTGSSGNAAEVTETDDYSIVLITKISGNENQTGILNEESIVYVDKVESAFPNAVTEFLIKANPTYGKYRAKLCSESGSTEAIFYIGIDTLDGDIAMTRVGEEIDPKGEGYWNVGYILEVPISDYNDFESVKVSYDSVDNYIENSSISDIKTGGYNRVAEVSAPYYKNWPDNISGEGNVKLAFQIDHVLAVYKDSITVYMSNSSVSDTYLNR